MQNKVGTVLPSANEMEALKADLQSVIDRLAKYTTTLSKEERLATTKFRPGGERMVNLIGELAKSYGIILPGISPEDMNTDLQLIQQLQPLTPLLDSLGQMLSDTILEAQSECWWATTAYYSALSRMAPADPKLEASLRPAIEFFAIGRRKNKSPDTTTPSTPSV